MRNTAAIDVEVALLPEAILALQDDGYEIVGSMDTAPWHPGSVRLVLAGDGLPPRNKDDYGLPLVSMKFEVEVHGRQRIVRGLAPERIGTA